VAGTYCKTFWAEILGNCDSDVHPRQMRASCGAATGISDESAGEIASQGDKEFLIRKWHDV
jgi:hypothetical protein